MVSRNKIFQKLRNLLEYLIYDTLKRVRAFCFDPVLAILPPK